MSEYDSPWKAILDDFFEPFVRLCFPELHAGVDWSRGYEPLDKELQRIAPDGAVGRKYVDKLLRVWRISGEEEWILVHVEIQNQADPLFAKRMFVYHYRLLDRYNRDVVSVAVWGAPGASRGPARYERELFGCRLEFTFPVARLAQWQERAERVLAAAESGDDADDWERNPFEVVIAAHLGALRTQGDLPARYNTKLAVIRSLYQSGLPPESVRKLFLFIDWVVDLPDEMTQRFSVAVHEMEQEMGKPYVSTLERFGIQQGIESVLRVRFGESGLALMNEVRSTKTRTRTQCNGTRTRKHRDNRTNFRPRTTGRLSPPDCLRRLFLRDYTPAR